MVLYQIPTIFLYYADWPDKPWIRFVGIILFILNVFNMPITFIRSNTPNEEGSFSLQNDSDGFKNIAELQADGLNDLLDDNPFEDSPSSASLPWESPGKNIHTLVNIYR